MKRRPLSGNIMVLLAAAAVLAAGCGGNGGGQSDADTEGPEDVVQDEAEIDVTPDPQPDDPPPDEATPDPAEDEAGEPQEDPDVVQDDGPGEEVFPECEAAGGVCTPWRWELCPSGLEPYAADPHSDCPGEGSTGWCCVDAPPSSCSDDSGYNCVVGTRCEDISGDLWGNCWGTPDGVWTCEDGRICCMDVCH
jgi:hypothetical protein